MGKASDGRDYRAEAKEWASVLHDAEARKQAEEAGELLLRKGFSLPKLVERDLGKGVLAKYNDQFGEIRINTNKGARKYGGFDKQGKMGVESGNLSQGNLVLHELGHYLDYTLRKQFPLSPKELIHDRFDDLSEDDVKRILSKYGASEAVEFRAELIAGILSGKSFPKEFLDAAYLDNYLSDGRGKTIYQMGSGEVPNTSMVEKQFGSMMEALFHEDGASLRIELLEHPEVTKFIGSHAQVLDNAFQQVEMSELMRSRLQESDWIFSGMKTFHELNEAFPSLLDENGERKPFERFLSDVQSIDETYNRHYLRAEYNYAEASAEMAAKWEDIERDGDDYNLQYRTAGDDKVRPEHAALHGVTLPPSDPFWDEYYPPNGWNCRCTVVQVLKDKYPTTDRVDALRRGQEALAKDTKGMFRFNSGKQGKTFPDYNPYTIKDCNTCTRKLELGADLAPNQLCQACPLIRSMAKKESTDALTEQDRFGIRKASEEWADRHLPEMTLPTGQKAKRLVVDNNGRSLIVSKGFFSKTFSQNAKRGRLGETMELATKIDLWLPSATLVGIEPGIHHPCSFLVYEAVVDGVTVQCKVKDQADKMVYTMRIKQEKD